MKLGIRARYRRLTTEDWEAAIVRLGRARFQQLKEPYSVSVAVLGAEVSSAMQ